MAVTGDEQKARGAEADPGPAPAPSFEHATARTARTAQSLSSMVLPSGGDTDVVYNISGAQRDVGRIVRVRPASRPHLPE
jgi:hypothetical protein